MIALRSVLAVAVLAGVCAAASSNSTFDPSSISSTQRGQWCNSQSNACNSICDNDYETNNCDPGTLVYSCICEGQTTEADVSDYLGTIPTFECEAIYAACIEDNPDNSDAQQKCTDARDCGKKDPDDAPAPSAASSSSPSATASSSGSSQSSSSSSATSAGASASATDNAASLNSMSGVVLGGGLLAWLAATL